MPNPNGKLSRKVQPPAPEDFKPSRYRSLTKTPYSRLVTQSVRIFTYSFLVSLCVSSAVFAATKTSAFFSTTPRRRERLAAAGHAHLSDFTKSCFGLGSRSYAPFLRMAFVVISTTQSDSSSSFRKSDRWARSSGGPTQVKAVSLMDAFADESKSLLSLRRLKMQLRICGCVVSEDS